MSDYPSPSNGQPRSGNDQRRRRDAPDADIEICSIEGEEGAVLAQKQAEVFRDILK